MIDSLRTLFKMFYAPRAAFAEARDRAPLGTLALIALVTHTAYMVYVAWADVRLFAVRPGALFSVMFGAAEGLLFVMLIVAPATILAANLLERKGKFGVVLRQEYTGTTSVLLLALAAAAIVALPMYFLFRSGGGETQFIQQMLEKLQDLAAQNPELRDPRTVRWMLASTVISFPFVLFSTLGVRVLFRLSWLRTASVVIAVIFTVMVTIDLWQVVFRVVSSLPLFLLFFLGIALRGYFGELVRTQQSRTRFKQNLEASTLNPADASAHYNLGLIHLDRREYADAQARFTRAVEIDADETDAHYQLGRIARLQGNHTEAITHFEQVVQRDEDHAQYEIWREIGATYLAAGQPEDARTALERFLDNRTTDPEGLFLMGRALAETDRTREAIDVMRRCIEAVKSAPAYKYRTDKRWMNEAQSFLRAQEQA